MAVAYWVTSTVCASDDIMSSSPPAKKFIPRFGGPGSVDAGYPPDAPYWIAVASPVTVHPGVATGVPSIEPAAVSASPLTMRLALIPDDGAGPAGGDDEL